jgi:hypothetical protein
LNGALPITGKSKVPFKNIRLQFFLVFVLSLVIQILCFDQSINPYDEGMILYGAQSVAHGGIPYKNFWSMYGPGSFYSIGALFKIFGNELLLLRAHGFIYKALISAVTFLILEGFSRNNLNVVISLFITILLVVVRNDGFPVFPATAYLLLAIFILQKEGSEPSKKDFLISGIFIGLATLFRHDLGFYGALAVFLPFVIERIYWDKLNLNCPPKAVFDLL